MPRTRQVIKASENSNNYCGPAALSIITGLSTSMCAGLVNKVRRKPGYMAVNGVWTEEMLQVLESENFSIESTNPKQLGSIYWVLSTIKQDGLYLAQLKTHYVVLDIKGNERTLCDNHTRTPIKAGNSSRLSQEVVGLYRVYRDEMKEPQWWIEVEAWGL